MLAVRPAGAGEVKQWTEMCRDYRFAGTALFLLTAAVPAASFYALSFDRHIEAFVKERQIGLARSINGVVTCNDVDPDDKIEGDNKDEHVVRYDDRGPRRCSHMYSGSRADQKKPRRSRVTCMRHSRTSYPTSHRHPSRCAN